MMEFAEKLKSILYEVTLEMKSDLDGVAKKIAEETAEELKRTSPKRNHSEKHYADGWDVEVTDSVNEQTKVYTVHNKNKPQLTHLLNKGHGKKGGGWVNGDSHIDNAEDAARKKMEAKAGEVIAKIKQTNY